MVQTQFETQQMDFLESSLVVNLDNVPKLIKEPFSDNIDNYKAKLILELKSIEYPNQVIKSF